MLEVGEVSKKLWLIIKNKHPELDDVGIQKIVDNLSELATFLVRSWAKDLDRTSENNPGDVFTGKPRDSPG